MHHTPHLLCNSDPVRRILLDEISDLPADSNSDGMTLKIVFRVKVSNRYAFWFSRRRLARIELTSKIIHPAATAQNRVEKA